MQHELADQHFKTYEQTKKWLNEWIALKDEEFFYRNSLITRKMGKSYS